MATPRTSALAGRHSSPLDFKRKPLSIPTLHRSREPHPAIDRVRGEFFEMRGFCPTLAQAARLFDLPLDECARILAALVEDGSLRTDASGRYRLRKA